MSFNRVKYDKSAYDLQMGRSTAPGDYRLFAPFAENCSQCFSYVGPVGSKADVSTVKEPMSLCFGEMRTVESDLSWRNNKLGKNNDIKLAPLNEAKLSHKPVCTNKLISEDTRFTHPIDNYRGISTTDLQLEPYLHVNPQCHIQESRDRIGLNSRSHLKDNIKIQKPEYLDKGEALPPNFEGEESNVFCPL